MYRPRTSIAAGRYVATGTTAAAAVHRQRTRTTAPPPSGGLSPRKIVRWPGSCRTAGLPANENGQQSAVEEAGFNSRADIVIAYGSGGRKRQMSRCNSLPTVWAKIGKYVALKINIASYRLLPLVDSAAGWMLQWSYSAVQRHPVKFHYFAVVKSVEEHERTLNGSVFKSSHVVG